MQQFTSDERIDLVNQLANRELLHRSLWGLTDVYFTDTVDRAAIQIVDSKVRMLFNKSFWESLPLDAQLFVVCHEQLHMILDHFNRLRFDLGDCRLKNIAADVAINHLLIRQYYFEQSMIPSWEQYCWTSTVFPDQRISDNETAEYYYSLLKNNNTNSDDLDDLLTIDDETPGEPTSLPNNIKEVLTADKEQATCCSNESEFKAGDGTTNQTQTHTYGKTSNKRSWKKLYMSIPKKVAGTTEQYHWMLRNRRHLLITSSAQLPGDFDTDRHQKIKVAVYLDTSGSCINDARYFLKTSLSLPPQMFEVSLFGFDADVYQINPQPPYQLHGFGGTSFQTVVDHAEDTSRFDIVFVFTDGYAEQPIIANPKQWHWFITPSGTSNYLPSSTNIYSLNDYDWRS